ncbi:trypsin-like peptidase domain-containing protein [Gemmatirosa kalamazoonensis]|uniref:trypsin-like peptidase domain-containing protein n=1 Tax=Gemmatirosa kalamazoonensis TaxID=861299 RepID=UPI00130DE5F6|nr:trypsin-like peptidase domain-containing protein [Gemmatirosa kalamazoonensis]
MRVVAATVLGVGGTLAFKYAPAQIASMTGQTPATLTAPAATPGAGGPQDSGFVKIARQVTPAVVYIENEGAPRVASRDNGGGDVPPGLRDLLPRGFQLVPPGGRGGRAPIQRSSGSGFIVSSDGEILTNNHVVEDANRLLVTLYDRRIYPARVIGRDPSTDVALIKIDATGLPTLPLGDDAAVQVGQPVLAIGAPLGLRSTVTSGIISAKERGGDLSNLFSSQLAIADFLQTDAVINPGNSGGPLLDMDGRVIGINSAIESPTGVYAGYGFAVPASIARIAMDQFHKYGRVRRAILGVSITDVKAEDALAAGMKEIRGALVSGFQEGSPAEKAGLKQGDIIVSVDNKPISSVAALQRTIYGYQPGQTVTLAYARYGTQGTARVPLQEAPPEKETVAANDAGEPRSNATPAGRLGVSVEPLTPELATQARVTNSSIHGLLVSEVKETGPARGHLIEGDVIVAVIGRGGVQRQITSGAQLKDAVDNAPGVISLLVYNSRLSVGAAGTRVVNVPLNQ